jgi:hypothetical protein
MRVTCPTHLILLNLITPKILSAFSEDDCLIGCETCGSHGGEYEDCCLLGCSAV